MEIIEEKFELKQLKGSISTRSVVPDDALAVLVLAHGAGAGIDHSFMKDIQNHLAIVEIASHAL